MCFLFNISILEDIEIIIRIKSMKINIYINNKEKQQDYKTKLF